MAKLLHRKLERSGGTVTIGNGEEYKDCLCLLIGDRIIFFDEEERYIGDRQATYREKRDLGYPHIHTAT